MNTDTVKSLKSLLDDKFATTSRDHYDHIFSLAVKYLKDVFKGHEIIETDRLADFHKRDVTLELDLTVRLRDGSLLTDVICKLGSYDIHYPERGAELIMNFVLSEEDYDELVEHWLDDADDADGNDMEPSAKRQRYL
jgi:hypothetical protein